VLVTLAIIAAAGSRSSTLRQLVIDTLSERLDSDVQLDTFSVDLFPTVDVRGEGLVVQLRGHADMPPLLRIRRFVMKGGLFGLLGRPRRFRQITLDGLEINIPPGGSDFADHYNRAASPESADQPSSSPLHIEQLESTDAVLRLIPRRAGKQPREFLIHRLTMQGVGITQRMPFKAELTNPIPRGAISTEGRFGPWGRDVPSATPVEGTYVFQNADLSTIKGIGGILTSTGKFHGPLGRIEVTGETKTPDFRLDVAGNPMPLSTTFEAVVDGTDGDTYLKSVDAQLGKTPIVASGVIAGTPGVKGRTVQVDAKITDGRIEDLLRLSVKGQEPLLTGNLSLHSEFTLPPGHDDVVDRMRLKGNFDLSAAQFTSRTVRAKLGEMSARATGKPDEVRSRVVSDLEGRFTVAGGVLSLGGLKFQIPGAAVQLDGTYGMRTGQLDFTGTLRMQATISEAAGDGALSVFLKIVDPLFKKKGAGTVLPIRVRGTREQPKFGVDVMKALTPK
jgi:AsmA-like C-terminal region